MALRREEKKKRDRNEHGTGPRGPRQEGNQPLEQQQEKTYTQDITIIGPRGGGGSISQPPGPTTPREPTEISQDGGTGGGDGGGGGPRSGAVVEKRLQRYKQVLEQHPPFGQCSQDALQAIKNRLQAGDALGQAVAILPVIDWMTSSPLELAATGDPDLENAARALMAVPQIIDSRIRNDIDMALVSCGSNGKMSGAEQKWWQSFRTLFR